VNSPLAGYYRSFWEQLGIPQGLIAERVLPLFEEADELQVAEVGPEGRQFLLTPPATTAWKEMKASAGREGIEIHIVSAYRSIQRQAELITRKLEAGQELDAILEFLAPPGCSEHHTGRAVDVGSGDMMPLEPDFDTTPAFAWLERCAPHFGFQLSFPNGNAYGYVYEPWHWCYTRPTV